MQHDLQLKQGLKVENPVGKNIQHKTMIVLLEQEAKKLRNSQLSMENGRHRLRRFAQNKNVSALKTTLQRLESEMEEMYSRLWKIDACMAMNAELMKLMRLCTLPDWLRKVHIWIHSLKSHCTLPTIWSSLETECLCKESRSSCRVGCKESKDWNASCYWCSSSAAQRPGKPTRYEGHRG